MSSSSISSSEKTTLFIVRHGQTDFNKQDKIQGSSNNKPENDLNETGVKEAIAVAEKLKDVAFDSVFTSDLFRAISTTKIITEKEPTIDPRLRERDWKVWEGSTMKEFKTDEVTHWTQVESDDEVRDRGVEALTEIATKNLGNDVLVVCHGGFMRNVLIRLLKLDCKVEDIKAGNTSYYTLIYADGSWHYGERSEGVSFPSDLLLSRS